MRSLWHALFVYVAYIYVKKLQNLELPGSFPKSLNWFNLQFFHDVIAYYVVLIGVSRCTSHVLHSDAVNLWIVQASLP